MTAAPPNPLGSCFDAAAHLLIGNDNWADPRMCHGTGVANKPGEEGTPIAHAWIEFDHPEHGRIAIDPIWLAAHEAEHYRRTLQVNYVVSYARAEFLRRWAEHNFPGPWDERVAALTVEGKAAAARGRSGIPSRIDVGFGPSGRVDLIRSLYRGHCCGRCNRE